ncbi:hypothetical protein HMPREF9447_03117 [Bacteroides oleiciplenus YIT 12058]|uniref:Uncharacterized protein n=2 Tax=Bacteroides oleiciplenus TaxID=626931 RepID=K9DXB9_9BACE|nr:hypothetical protein HMPREF9447_03117 [Bacteroides oleiciplenus YIT 12058]
MNKIKAVCTLLLLLFIFSDVLCINRRKSNSPWRVASLAIQVFHNRINVGEGMNLYICKD